MIYYLIPLVVIIASFVGIFLIVSKKFPNLAAINVESIPKEKEAKVINRIMIERLNRKFITTTKTLQKVFEPIGKATVDLSNRIYQNITDLEKKTSQAQAPLGQIGIAQQVADKLEEVKEIFSQGDFTKAEEICISIIELDPKNLEAYQILSNVYLANKDYKKARETCRYLLKLMNKTSASNPALIDKHKIANSCADLGWIYQLENKNSFALTNYQKAVELEPNNPRFLDLLLKVSIMLKNKSLASEVFSNLQQTDPDNQKLPDLEAEIKNLPNPEKK
ncbi:MAG: tetratricopeptide repeat protein [Candidatus Buchananbacteria bacterium]